VVTLLARGMQPSEVAQQTACPARTVRYIARQYRALGLAALLDGRRRTQGTRQLLSRAQEDDLRLALQQPPSDAARWSGPRVARWMSERTGLRVSRQRGWEYLRRLRPAHS
jgi:transposase